VAAFLEVDGVSLDFGGIHALDAVTLAVAERTIHALIGPNGAGKSTLLNVLTGHYRAQSGDVRLEGHSICRLPPHRVARRGIARTFQNLELFVRLSVIDNVLVGCQSRDAAWRTDGLYDEARRLLAVVGLELLAHREAGALAYGQQKLLELARALSVKPKLLLLDEPASGLSTTDVARLGEVLRDVAASEQLTILLVEHHMGLVMGISDVVTVLDHGRVIAEGPPAQVRSDPGVVTAYLGNPDAAAQLAREDPC
jgi:ABC-type branched-subunit amino acid transport system ATPase component